MTSLRSLSIILLFATLTACIAPENDEDTGASAGSDGTDGGSAGSAAGDTDANDSATSTTGATGSDAQNACEAYCHHIVECFPEEAAILDDCLHECGFVSEDGSEACQAAYVEWFGCIADLDCSLFEGSEEFCTAQETAVEQQCSGDSACEGYVGMGEGGCEYGEICPDGERRFSCDSSTATCTCYENDVETATCALEASCAEVDFVDQAAACCDWAS